MVATLAGCESLQLHLRISALSRPSELPGHIHVGVHASMTVKRDKQETTAESRETLEEEKLEGGSVKCAELIKLPSPEY